jgi:hypothetical protein
MVFMPMQDQSAIFGTIIVGNIALMLSSEGQPFKAKSIDGAQHNLI